MATNKVDVLTGRWRYLLLLCTLLIGYGLYFNVDVPSALQKDLQDLDTGSCANLTANLTCCWGCLGLGADRYNQLYAAYAWMTAAVALPGGYFMDRLGNRVSAIMSTTVAWLGTILFAISTMDFIRGTTAMFPMMFCSRLLLGAGTGTALITQERILTMWFPDNLALVFSINVVTLRLGNVSNFLLSANIAKWIGLTWALWLAASVCCTAVICAILFSLFDFFGKRRMQTDMGIPEIQNDPTTPRRQLRNIRLLPKTYWFLCLSLLFYYSAYLPVIGNGSKYIQDRYGYSTTTASYYNGAVYDVSVIISPFLGILLRKINCTGIALCCSAILTVPVYLLMLFSPHNIHPLILTVYLGITYTTFAVCVWPCFAMLVHPSIFGTAVGLAVFIQSIGVGMTNLGVGKLLGSTRSLDVAEQLSNYGHMFWLLFALSVLAALFSLITNIADITHRNLLNPVLSKDKGKELKQIISEKSPLISDQNVNAETG